MTPVPATRFGSNLDLKVGERTIPQPIRLPPFQRLRAAEELGGFDLLYDADEDPAGLPLLFGAEPETPAAERRGIPSGVRLPAGTKLATVRWPLVPGPYLQVARAPGGELLGFIGEKEDSSGESSTINEGFTGFGRLDDLVTATRTFLAAVRGSTARFMARLDVPVLVPKPTRRIVEHYLPGMSIVQSQTTFRGEELHETAAGPKEKRRKVGHRSQPIARLTGETVGMVLDVSPKLEKAIFVVVPPDELAAFVVLRPGILDTIYTLIHLSAYCKAFAALGLEL